MVAPGHLGVYISKLEDYLNLLQTKFILLKENFSLSGTYLLKCLFNKGFRV